jgi:hypothetical protein
MVLSLSPHKAVAIFWTIPALMLGSANADSNIGFQISNAAIRIVASQEICLKMKPIHAEAEVSYRLGYFDDWKRIFSLRMLEAGAKTEQLNDFLRYIDGIFADGAATFDEKVCQAFVYSGFGIDYWEKDLREFIKIDNANAAQLKDISMREYIKSEELKLCDLAKEFWERSCPVVEY